MSTQYVPQSVEDLRRQFTAMLREHGRNISHVGMSGARTMAHVFFGMVIGGIAVMHRLKLHQRQDRGGERACEFLGDAERHAGDGGDFRAPRHGGGAGPLRLAQVGAEGRGGSCREGFDRRGSSGYYIRDFAY